MTGIPTMAEVQDGYYDDEAIVDDYEEWTPEAEDASWLREDDAARRREDR